VRFSPVPVVARLQLGASIAIAHAPDEQPAGASAVVAGIVAATVRPILRQYHIPGMAVTAAYGILTALGPMQRRSSP
jgi:uncharacterized membrane protein YvlD (DUF360 family)